VVGSGMIGSAFSTQSFDMAATIFCSGVSNSLETRQREFDREISLIKSIHKKNEGNIFVYFSSVMAEKSDAPYYLHKIQAENLIKKIFKNYLILRLPQVVGFTKNNTLVTFIIRALIRHEKIRVQNLSRRSIIDVEDVVRIVKKLLNKKIICQTIQICPSNNISAYQLVEIISQELNILPTYEYQNIGINQCCDCTYIKEILEKDVIFSDNYVDLILKKYIKKIALMEMNESK
jgi:nucleoside-diphosphate-sugar epimerase